MADAAMAIARIRSNVQSGVYSSHRDVAHLLEAYDALLAQEQPDSRFREAQEALADD